MNLFEFDEYSLEPVLNETLFKKIKYKAKCNRSLKSLSNGETFDSTYACSKQIKDTEDFAAKLLVFSEEEWRSIEADKTKVHYELALRDLAISNILSNQHLRKPAIELIESLYRNDQNLINALASGYMPSIERLISHADIMSWILYYAKYDPPRVRRYEDCSPLTEDDFPRLAVLT